MNDKPADYFWRIAEPLLKQNKITRGTLMGFPCLRYAGEFFATADHRNGNLIVKLPAARASEMIANGQAQAFAPAGKVFREWIQVSERDGPEWKSLMLEAKDFAQQKKRKKP